MQDPDETPTPVAKWHSTTEMLASMTDAEVLAKEVGWLLLIWSGLWMNAQERYAKLRRAEQELQATERLIRLAHKHEDLAVARGLSQDADYLREIIPLYQERSRQDSEQQYRLWRVLVTHCKRVGLVEETF